MAAADCRLAAVSSSSLEDDYPFDGGDGSFVEVAAVLSGRGAEPATERPVHGLSRAEPAGAGDLLDGGVGALQETAGCLQADRLDVVGRGDPHLCLEHPA